MTIWDIYGQDEFQSLQPAYLRGSSGCLLVADGTRAETLNTAVSLRQLVTKTIGPVPLVLVLNKVDLTEHWQLGDRQLASLPQDLSLIRTSAKTGAGVEDAFATLARLMIS